MANVDRGNLQKLKSKNDMNYLKEQIPISYE